LALAPAAPELGVTASGGTAPVGQVVNASYTITNRGDARVAAKDVVIELAAPAGTELADFDRLYPANQCNVVKPRRQVRCRPSNPAFFQPGQSVSASLPILVTRATAAAGFVRVALAGDPVAANNVARFTITSSNGPTTPASPTRSATPRATASASSAAASDQPYVVDTTSAANVPQVDATNATSTRTATAGASPLIWVGGGIILVAVGLIASLFVLRRRDRREDAAG
jgi:hypothetical protein